MYHYFNLQTVIISLTYKIVLHILTNNFKYLAEISVLSQQEIEEIRNKIVHEVNPQKIYIFGSYARENAGEESDIDLLVIMDSTLNPHQRNLKIKKLFRRRRFSLDAFVYTPEEAMKYKEIPGTILHNAVYQGKLIYG